MRIQVPLYGWPFILAVLLILSGMFASWLGTQIPEFGAWLHADFHGSERIKAPFVAAFGSFVLGVLLLFLSGVFPRRSRLFKA